MKLWPCVYCLLGIASSALAGRPLVTNDAYAIDLHHVQIEAGVGYVYDEPTHHWDVPLAVGYGLLPRLEVSVGLGGVFEERLELGGHDIVSGIGDLTISAKWQFLEHKSLGDHALSATIKFPTADDEQELGSGHIDADLTWIITRKLGDQVELHANLGFTFTGPVDDSNLVHYGLAATWQATELLQPVLEVFGQTLTDSRGETAVAVNGGLRLSILENLKLDASAGARIHGDYPGLFLSLGGTWVFNTRNN